MINVFLFQVIGHGYTICFNSSFFKELNFKQKEWKRLGVEFYSVFEKMNAIQMIFIILKFSFNYVFNRTWNIPKNGAVQ